jgi:LPXTG-site transpeptidase (sortase) family protein
MNPHIADQACSSLFRTRRARMNFTGFKYFRNLLCIGILVISALGIFSPVSIVSADSHTVTNTNDSGAGSLRQAISDAASGDTIIFSGVSGGTINLITQITINKDLEINGGTSATSITLSGGNSHRIFFISSGTVRLRNMTLSNGHIKGDDGSYNSAGANSGLGGAVYVAGGAGLIATSVNFTNNQVIGGNGGSAGLVGETNSAGGGGGAGGLPGNPGQYGGGGGGGFGSTAGGSGGFGAGGGGTAHGYTLDSTTWYSVPGGAGGEYGGKGSDGHRYINVGYSGGGGGAALGGAIFVEQNGSVGIEQSSFTSNSVTGGNGGNGGTGFGGGGGGGGAGLGSAVFSAGSLCIRSGVSFSSNSLTAGAAGTSVATAYGGYLPGVGNTTSPATPASAGQAVDTVSGYFLASTGDTSCAVFDYAPTDMIFTPASLAENSAIGTSAGSLSTTDPDTGDTFTYSLVSGSGSTDNGYFSISGANIVTATGLNFESKHTFGVRVRSTDAAGKYYEEAFTITITDAPDAPADINLSANWVDENLGTATIGSLITSDEDEGSTFTYNLQTGVSGCDDSGNDHFSINLANLLSTVTFDYETQNSYNICVRSTDNAGLTIDKQFQILIHNINEVPTDLSIIPQTLDENLSGAVAASLSTTDPDAGDTFTYSLVSGSGSTDNSYFSVDNTTDEILTASALNFESKSSYSIRVRSTDAGGLYVEQAATIVLSDVNEPPTSVTLSSSSVQENQSVGALIGDLSSTDPDAGDMTGFSYVLEGDGGSCTGDDNSSFNINSNGYSLDSAEIFDYETKDTYSICVKSTDDDLVSPEYLYQPLTISITDANDAPTDISLSSASIVENSSVGTVIGGMDTTDQDKAAGDTFSYSLVSGSGDTDNNSFTISGSNLLSRKIFDFESKTSYSIRVQTSDSQNETYQKAFTISITDAANEPPTDISLDDAAVAENQSIGTIVGGLTSTDPDGGSAFTYSLVAGGTGCEGTDNASFSISAGGSNLLTAEVFDHESKETYAICIQSTDNGTPAASMVKSFTITVDDVNEAPSGLALSLSSIGENQPSGTTVGSFSTTDEDDGDTFSYALAAGSGDTDNGSFTISGSTLRSAVIFDYETKSSYSIRVQVKDSADHIYEKGFTISINDGGDTPTNISLSPSTMDEGLPVGTLVGTLTTTDADAGDSFTYTLVGPGSSSNNDLFTITGDQLNTAAVLDYETLSSLTVRIQTEDSTGLTYAKTLTITVDNVNETPIAGTIPDQSGTVGVAFTYTFPAGTFSDPDGNLLTYSAEVASGAALPAWLTFDESACEFHGTAIQTTTLSIRVIASDGLGLTANTIFGIVFNAQSGNHAPVVVHPIPDQLTSAGAFEYVYSENTFADFDLDPLTYQATQSDGSALPVGISFSSSERKLSGTSPLSVIVVRITALDGRGGETYTDFNLGPLDNTAPFVQTPIPDQIAGRGSVWTFTVPPSTFADGDGDTLAYSADQTNGLILPVWLSFDPASHTFSGTLPVLGESIYDLRVTVTDGVSGHATSDSFLVGPWLANPSATSNQMGISVLSLDVSGSGSGAIPSRTVRWDETADIRTFYGATEMSDLNGNTVQICYELSADELLHMGGSLSRLSIGTSHDGGAWQLLETNITGANQICASATQFSLFDVFEQLSASKNNSLPATGFTPGKITLLAKQPAELAYTGANDVQVEIPALGVDTIIVGVPLVDGQWNVDWLGGLLGWLEGSAFPGNKGNSALAGHEVDSNGQPGVFADLGELKWGDQIIIRAFNVTYIYEVRKVNRWVKPDDMNVLKHEDLPWLTLITCHGYQKESDTYQWRTVVQAVLIETGSD